MLILKNLNRLNKLAFVKRYFSFGKYLNQSKSNDDIYRQVPHYTQNSALFIKSPSPSETKVDDPVFPKIVAPEINMDHLFKSDNILKSLLNLNLTSRHIHIDLVLLKQDFLKMRHIETQIDLLNKQKEEISVKINNLVKSKGGQTSKKLTMQTEEAKELIQSGNNIKSQINKLLEQLLPLQEIVNIVCLRLPNFLHFSTLFLHSYQLSKETDRSLFQESELESEENSNKVLFDLNSNKSNSKFNLLNSQTSWQYLLDDSILIDGKQVKAKYNKNLTEKWSFVEQSQIDSVLNNKYLVGTYAKLEQALVNYFFNRIESLNKNENGFSTFEHVKSSSMFKSAIVEGVGEKFNDFRNIFNVVRFSSNSKKPDAHHSNIELLHLTGASSLSALVLNFIRTKIQPKYLPWTVFTNAKSYSPKSGQINSFDFLTLTSDSSGYLFDYDHQSKSHNGLTDEFLKLILSNGKAYLEEIKNELKDCFDGKNVPSFNKNLDRIFVDYLKLFVYIYKDFNIPMRFVCINAYDLKSNESFKVEVQAYLPSEQTYLAIGEVSLLNDYISSRLQIRLDEGGNRESLKHVNMVYCRLVNLNIFTQILIESNLVKSKGEENDELLAEAGSFDSQTDLLFSLPDILKKYYMI